MRYTVTEMKERNAAMGNFFFSKDTMRFFSSKVIGGTDDNGYFITSEQFVPFDGPAHPRTFTIRHFDFETGEIRTVGEFQRYSTIEAARAARRLLPVPATK